MAITLPCQGVPAYKPTSLAAGKSFARRRNSTVEIQSVNKPSSHSCSWIKLRSHELPQRPLWRSDWIMEVFLVTRSTVISSEKTSRLEGYVWWGKTESLFLLAIEKWLTSMTPYHAQKWPRHTVPTARTTIPVCYNCSRSSQVINLSARHRETKSLKFKSIIRWTDQRGSWVKAQK